ncbi:MAG: choice-of-anchor B family protein [Flavobacteriales bacterium]
MKFLYLALATFLSSILFGQTPCVNGTSGGYPCENVELLSHLTSSELGGGEMNDLWGWTSPESGKEYVMIGRDAGTSFVDISDPLFPVYLGVLPTHTFNSIWRDIKVYENHAFIVSEANNHGMQVFNLMQLETVVNPPVVFEDDAHYGVFGDCHNIVINEESGYAYAVGSNTANGGLHVIDVTSPTQPTLAGFFSNDGYTHDAQAVNYIGPDPDYTGSEIVFAANENNIAIIDVTDKSDMELIEHATYPSLFYTHQCWLTEDHRFLLANDELDELNGSGNTRTFIFNVEDLNNPIYLGAYVHPTAAIDHNLYIHEGYVYQSNYRAGLRILNTDQVSNGVLNEVAFFDVYPQSNAAAFNGSWSNYPYFESGVVAVSHIENGLFLLKPDIKTFYADADSDGFGDDLVTAQGFTSPEGFVENNLDCDDALETVFPGATGTGEGIDNDCNGEVEGDEMESTCPEDFNSDGIVSIEDISIFLSGFGCISQCEVDLNGDGLTSIDDLSLFLIAFGTVCD